MDKDTIFLGVGAGLTAYSTFLAKGNKVFGAPKKYVQIGGVALLAYGAYCKFFKNKAPPMPMPLPAPIAAGGGPPGAMPIATGASPVAIGGGGSSAGLPIIPTNSSDTRQASMGTTNGIGALYGDLL